MLNISAEHKKEHLYLEVYHYYRKLILEGRLLPGSKMPSLRKCAQELKLSRTTIENAYLLLAADGYIIARAQSGYYVTGIASKQHLLPPEKQDKDITPCLYDFASSGVDRESFRFDLWQRYIKSALRQGDRMLSYGEPQGESDFREVLADYIRERRNVICSPDDIVVGAGLQPLLQILCPLIHERKTVSFPTPSFTTCSTIFQDYGFDVHYRDKSCDVIYVSPAHMTKWGEIMPVKRRLELIRHAEINDHLIIEDDSKTNLFIFRSRRLHFSVLQVVKTLSISVPFPGCCCPPSVSASWYCRALSGKNIQKKQPFIIRLLPRQNRSHSASLSATGIWLPRLEAPPPLFPEAEGSFPAVRETFGQDCQIQTGAAGTSLALTLPVLSQAVN